MQIVDVHVVITEPPLDMPADVGISSYVEVGMARRRRNPEEAAEVLALEKEMIRRLEAEYGTVHTDTQAYLARMIREAKTEMERP